MNFLLQLLCQVLLLLSDNLLLCSRIPPCLQSFPTIGKVNTDHSFFSMTLDSCCFQTKFFIVLHFRLRQVLQNLDLLCSNLCGFFLLQSLLFYLFELLQEFFIIVCVSLTCISFSYFFNWSRIRVMQVFSGACHFELCRRSLWNRNTFLSYKMVFLIALDDVC